MRSDMFKVIVNRPRVGVRNAPRVKLRLDPLPDRSFAGMRRMAAHQNRSTKYLNENLAPLQRYLWKQRGRPWNKVYGEISATLDGRSTVKQHVRDHLDDLIVTKVTVGRGGRWYGLRHRGGPAPLEVCSQRLYVDPRDGIIKETGKYRRKRGLPEVLRWGRPAPSPVTDRVVLSDEVELRLIDGIWYRVHFDERPEQGPEAKVFDLLTRERVWPGRCHAVMKRQLSRVELENFKLSNLA